MSDATEGPTSSRRGLLQGGAAFTVLGLVGCRNWIEEDKADSAIHAVDLYQPPKLYSEGGSMHVALRLTMVDRVLHLPLSGDAGAPLVQVMVHSYSYVVDGVTEEGPGPTLVLEQGDRLKVTLHNDLDPYVYPDPPIEPATDELAAAIEANGGTRGMNFPHEINATNLHLHGLRGSPKDGADSVRTIVSAGESYDYDFGVVADGSGGVGNDWAQPAGTQWYHPHKHGSTLHQFFFGVAGAIVVRGGVDDYLDTYLRDPREDDRVLIISSLALPGDLSRFVDAGESVVGPPINEYALNAPDVFDYPVDAEGELDYDNGVRPTAHLMLNGQYQPVIFMESGRLQRWRFINAHAATTHNLVILAYSPTTDFYDPAISTDLRGVAVDGMTLVAPVSFNANPEDPDWGLAPGGRLDAMIRIDQPGTYRLAAATVGDEGTTYKPIADIVVEIGGPVDDYPDTLPESTREPRLDSDFEVSNPDSPHRVAFGMDKTAVKQFDVPPFHEFIFLQFDWNYWDGDNTPDIGKLYDPERIDYAMAPNDAELWEVLVPWHLQEPHPFHMHTNPFFVTEIVPLDPDDNEPIESEAIAINRWYDTIGVDPGHLVRFKTIYRNHTGDAVLHCHIIGHGTWGMMQSFRIVDEGEPVPDTPFYL